MKNKYIFMMLSACALMSSCQKNASSVQTPQENQPVHLTLTAAIGGNDTKIAYVDEDNVLKTKWEQFDKVSVFSLDISGNVLTNDVFTATSVSADGKIAEFEGDFSNHAEAKSIYVYYPALNQGKGTEEDPWHVAPVYEGAEGVLNGVTAGKTYLTFNTAQLQKNLVDCTSHLEQYTVMSGKAEMEEGNLLVDLEHRSYVLKVQLKLPQSGLTVKHLTISAKSAADAGVRVSGSGWTDIYSVGAFPGGWDTSYLINFGTDYAYGSGTGLLVEGESLTTYIVAFAGQSWDYEAQETTWYHLTSGDYFSFTLNATTDGSDSYICTLDKLEIPKDVVLENGKMYRLSATLEKEQAE